MLTSPYWWEARGFIFQVIIWETNRAFLDHSLQLFVCITHISFSQPEIKKFVTHNYNPLGTHIHPQFIAHIDNAYLTNSIFLQKNILFINFKLLLHVHPPKKTEKWEYLRCYIVIYNKLILYAEGLCMNYPSNPWSCLTNFVNIWIFSHNASNS